MITNIEPTPAHSIAELDERARAYAEAARAPATLRAYATDWRVFPAWCVAHDVDALPATPAHGRALPRGCRRAACDPTP